MNYLTKEKFIENAENNKNIPHWDHYLGRWCYHERARDILKSLNITDPKTILEIGAMGVPLAEDSITMDYGLAWCYNNQTHTITHDCRKFPYPCKDKEYKVVSLLRCFQHFYPVQERAFNELKRIAENIIIVTPSVYKEVKGVKPLTFTAWNNNKPATICEKIMNETTYIYFWSANDLS